MGGILAPETRPALPKNYHRENLQMMHQREQEVQKKREDDVRSQAGQEPWKMRRFQSVESKVRS